MSAVVTEPEGQLSSLVRGKEPARQFCSGMQGRGSSKELCLQFLHVWLPQLRLSQGYVSSLQTPWRYTGDWGHGIALESSVGKVIFTRHYTSDFLWVVLWFYTVRVKALFPSAKHSPAFPPPVKSPMQPEEQVGLAGCTYISLWTELYLQLLLCQLEQVLPFTGTSWEVSLLMQRKDDSSKRNFPEQQQKAKWNNFLLV